MIVRPTPSQVFAVARAAMSGPLVWGANDCCMAAAAAWATLWGRDPLAGWRGTYAGRKAALRLLRRGGGALALADDAFAELRRVETPQSGDLMIARTDRLTLAICVETRADGVVIGIGKGAAGAVVMPMNAMRAWTCV